MGKRILRILLGIVAIILVGVIALIVIGTRIANKEYFYTSPFYEVPNDPATLARGEHLVKHVAGCTACHGDDLSGTLFMDANPVAKLPAPNLTKGIGGVGNRYTPEFMSRLLRHGVKQDSRGALVMPIEDYQHMSQEDMAAIAAYVSNVPRVEKIWSRGQLGILGRILIALGQFPPPAPEGLDHEAPFPITAPPEAVTVEYGDYLASISCKGCHGQGLAGGAIPGGNPDAPIPTNLTPSGALADWSEAQFATLLQTGVNPSGRQLDNEHMPWQAFAGLSENEVAAIWLYLGKVPAKEFGTR